MTKPTLTHAVAVVEADDKHALIVCGSNNEHRYWVPLNALHPLPPTDPLAVHRAAVIHSVMATSVDLLPNFVVRALNDLLAAERALAQPEPEPLRECKCGATPTMTQVSGHAGPMAQVVCAECGRRGPNCWTVATAAAAWNERPERADARAVIGELAQAGKHFQQKTVAFYEAAKENGYATAWGRDVGTKFVEAETRWNAAKAAAEALVKGAG